MKERDETRALSGHYTIGRSDAGPAEIYWLLFLAGARREAELLRAHKTRQLLPTSPPPPPFLRRKEKRSPSPRIPRYR